MKLNVRIAVVLILLAAGWLVLYLRIPSTSFVSDEQVELRPGRHRLLPLNDPAYNDDDARIEKRAPPVPPIPVNVIARPPKKEIRPETRIQAPLPPQKFPNKASFTQIAPDFTVQTIFDDRRIGNMGQRSVRIFLYNRRDSSIPATAHKSSLPNLTCIFDKKDHVEGTWYELSENHARPWAAFILSCAVPQGIEYVDDVVIDNSEGKVPWTSPPLPINYIVPAADPEEYTWEYSICSPLLFGSKYSVEDFVEWIELNRILGVQHITIYVDSPTINGGVKKAIEHYRKEGILEPIELHETMKEVWYHGQLGMIEDCLLRHTNASRFVAFQDVDEFIVSPPLGMSTLDILRSSLAGDVGSLRVPTQAMSINNSKHPRSLSNTETFGVEDTLTTKCVVRPHMVFEQGIHHTSRVIYDHLKMERASFVNLRVYHYRRTDPFTKNDTSVIDKYGEKLKKAFDQALGFVGRAH